MKKHIDCKVALNYNDTHSVYGNDENSLSITGYEEDQKKNLIVVLWNLVRIGSKYIINTNFEMFVTIFYYSVFQTTANKP